MLITGYKERQEIVEIYYRKSESNPNTVERMQEEEKFLQFEESKVVSGEGSTIDLLHINLPGRKIGDDQESFISFDYRYDIYILNELTEVFTPLIFDCWKSYQTIYDLYSDGVSEPTEYNVLYDIYESATIKLPKKSMFGVFAFELYSFQIFSICLWYFDEYFYYTTSVLTVLVLTILYELWQYWSDGDGINKITTDE